MSRRENRAKELKRYGVNKLVEDYIKLEEEKKEYQTALDKELARIRNMKPYKRFWQRGKLLWNLIKQLEQGFKNKV